MKSDISRLVDRADSVFDRIERIINLTESLLLPPYEEPDWTVTLASRWKKQNGHGFLEPVTYPHLVEADSLLNIDRQKSRLDRNTRQFISGIPANNALLWGSRGTGKSSLVKAMLNEYSESGLRLIEVDTHYLSDLPEVIRLVQNRPEKFIVYCDDLSFEYDDPSYKALKAILEGSIAAKPKNVLVYATSNRRHLIPEYLRENELSLHVGDEIHHSDTTEEKISLSERFGLCLAFHPFAVEEYLHVCFNSAQALGVTIPDHKIFTEHALRFATERGGRSGRVAWQYALDTLGKGLGV